MTCKSNITNRNLVHQALPNCFGSLYGKILFKHFCTQLWGQLWALQILIKFSNSIEIPFVGRATFQYTVFPHIGIISELQMSMSWDHLIFIMGTPILLRWHLCIGMLMQWHGNNLCISLLALFEGNPLVTGGFSSQFPIRNGPVLWRFDVLFVVCLSKLLNKQWSCQWFEIPHLFPAAAHFTPWIYVSIMSPGA